MLSIELVPRDIEKLRREAVDIATEFKEITWLNIPDIKRLEVRSHDAALATTDVPLHVIPHVRARDRSTSDSVELVRQLADAGIRDVLIVTGDQFDGEDCLHPTSLEVLRAVRNAHLNVTPWAAFDPYRGDLIQEIDYAKQKIDAGAMGFFTQPFFDTNLAWVCLEQLRHVDTFVGISPVTSEKSARYWERTNRVVFPEGFTPTLEHSIGLSRELIELANDCGQHAYLMPITVDAVTYLRSVFADVKARETILP